MKGALNLYKEKLLAAFAARLDMQTHNVYKQLKIVFVIVSHTNPYGDINDNMKLNYWVNKINFVN